MRHRYVVFFELSNTCFRNDVEALVSQRASLQLPEHSRAVSSMSEADIRWLLSAAQELGCRCILHITTFYDREDILGAPFGMLQAGNVQPERFRAVLPKDAFDFSGACGTCGLGARQVKPHLLSQQSLRCEPGYYGTDDSHSVLLPTPVAQKVIEATGQPECMRNPMTRSGEVVTGYMEPVPLATMPLLSRELCEGISFGRTDSVGSIGEPPKVVPPCPECGREIWDFDHSQHSRLVYARKGADSMKSVAVVVMDEPWSGFPMYDPKQRMFKRPGFLPWLLLNHDAIRVLIDCAVSPSDKDTILITPVYVE